MIRYGQGECYIDYNVEKIESIKIIYFGKIKLTHPYRELRSVLNNNQMRVKNLYDKNSLLIHGNNQIHIGFLNQNKSKFKLFN